VNIATLSFRGFVTLCFLFLVFLTACSDDDPTSPENSVSLTTVLQGTYQDSKTAITEQGLLLDLDVTNGQAQGKVVFRIEEYDDNIAFPLSGTLDSEQLSLTLDTDLYEHPENLTIAGTFDVNGNLSGSFTFSSADLVCTLSCTPITEIHLDTAQTITQNVYGQSLVHYNSDLWLSGAYMDHMIMETTGAIIGTIPVFLYPDLSIHWGTASLAYDDNLFYGSYPISSSSGNESTSTSEIIEFLSSGSIQRRVQTDHRINGLTYRDDALWSMGSGITTLMQLDNEGTATAYLVVNRPALQKLTWDGTHFWTMNSYLPVLIRIDETGTVDGFFRLPNQTFPVHPAGLSWSDGHLWVGQKRIGAGDILYSEFLPAER